MEFFTGDNVDGDYAILLLTLPFIGDAGAFITVSGVLSVFTVSNGISVLFVILLCILFLYLIAFSASSCAFLTSSLDFISFFLSYCISLLKLSYFSF